MNNNIFKGKFGIEKEALRIDNSGVISLTPHPTIFKESNPYITKDFAEAQIEMITPPMPSLDLCIHTLEDIQHIVLQHIGDDLLWNQSNPAILPSEQELQVASFVAEPNKAHYRSYLSKKYAFEKSIISGIHFNFSFDETYLKGQYLSSKETISFNEYKNKEYMKVAKYLLRDRWFLTYLTSASPIFHTSFYDDCVSMSSQKENGDCEINGMHSLRNSSCGFRNTKELTLDYSSLEAYDKSVERHVQQGNILQASELYTPIRLKKDEDGNIAYLELRFLDINPLEKSGVSKTDLAYVHLYLIYALLQKDIEFDANAQHEANHLHDIIAKADHEELTPLLEKMQQMATMIEKTFQGITSSPYDLLNIFSSIRKRLLDVDQTYAKQLLQKYEESSFIAFNLQQAKQQKEEALRAPFLFKSYPNLELSTKILLQEAITKGILFDVYDEESNFVSLKDPIDGNVQLVQQATKTNLDAYANVLAMENKLVTKRILEDHHVLVPKGDVLHSKEEFQQLNLTPYKQHGVVVKPNTTNFGVGITIYPEGANKQMIKDAVDFAFEKDDTVLLEPFISGLEYRFLVIGEEVVGVLHRKAANVVGDGIHTIEELVEEKNKHPFRGSGYKTPLEYLRLGHIEEDFLQTQGYTKTSIPAADETVFLRENSNISTGGDSIDVSDEIHESYKEVALQATRALQVQITGVDIMIDDVTQPANDTNYGVLELNFNPAIHIHTYPLVGKNRMPASKVLNLLFPQKKVSS